MRNSCVYQVLSASQLFRVYLDYDLLQAAAQLCMEYLDALLGVLQGQDSPAFGLKVSGLQPNTLKCEIFRI